MAGKGKKIRYGTRNANVTDQSQSQRGEDTAVINIRLSPGARVNFKLAK